MSRFAEYTTVAKTQTVYFAYGSNLHLAQMASRCPESRYLGLGILHDYKWQINTRGFANVIPSRGDKVEGLCYLLSKKDERSLDRSEGVPRAYGKLWLPVDVFSANAYISGRRVGEVNERIQLEIRQLRDAQLREQAIYHDMDDNEHFKITPEYHPSTGVTLKALVYVNEEEVRDGIPKEEYKTRIAAGVGDAIALGVPHRYFDRNFREPMARRNRDTRTHATKSNEDRHPGRPAASPHLSRSADHETSYERQGSIPTAYPDPWQTPSDRPYLSRNADHEMADAMQDSTPTSYPASGQASSEGPQETRPGPRGGSSNRVRKSNRGGRGTGEGERGEGRNTGRGRNTSTGETHSFMRYFQGFGRTLLGAVGYTSYEVLPRTMTVRTPYISTYAPPSRMQWSQEDSRERRRRHEYGRSDRESRLDERD